MSSPQKVLVHALVAAAGLGAAAPAQASDASVRKAVKAQEVKVDAAAKDFTAMSEDAVSAIGRERATTSAKKLRTALARAKSTVTKQKATGTGVKRGRTRYLAALASTLTGLKTFEQGLTAYDPDSPSKAATLVTKARAQLKTAATRRDSAARLVRG